MYFATSHLFILAIPRYARVGTMYFATAILAIPPFLKLDLLVFTVENRLSLRGSVETQISVSSVSVHSLLTSGNRSCWTTSSCVPRRTHVQSWYTHTERNLYFFSFAAAVACRREILLSQIFIFGSLCSVLNLFCHATKLNFVVLCKFNFALPHLVRHHFVQLRLRMFD